MKNKPLHTQFCTFSNDTPLFNGQPIPLGGMSVQDFLKHYWHKKPLLIRNALPQFEAFFTPADVLAALQDEHVESRLITQTDGWQMLNGPLRKKQMPSNKQKNWTALIQGVDVHNAHGHALLNLFRFIPDARLDDLMVSLASDGGGVGPHYDSYDVFLLQAHGQRRWQIGASQDLSLKPNMPLKILQNFVPTEEFVLEAGDMLYLPPQYAHDGVAVGDDCMTYSIGFRAPTYREIGVALLNFVEDNLELEGRYADPKLKYQTTPAALPAQMVDDMYQNLQQMRWDKTWVAECLGCYLSEPKDSAWFAPNESLSLKQFIKAASKNGLVLAPATKMLYYAPWVFINGEHLIAGGEDAVRLQQLANLRVSDGQFPADADIWAVMYEWYCAGWLHCGC